MATAIATQRQPLCGKDEVCQQLKCTLSARSGNKPWKPVLKYWISSDIAEPVGERFLLALVRFVPFLATEPGAIDGHQVGRGPVEFIRNGLHCLHYLVHGIAFAPPDTSELL